MLTRSRRSLSLGKLLWIIIALSLLVHVASVVVGRTVLEGRQWEHEPIHAAVEIAGALVALCVAAMLINLERRAKGTSYNTWIAGALVGMGLLDGLHALVYVGNTFVWLHSTATFVGGALFALVWMPRRWSVRARRWWHWSVLAAVLAFGLLSIGCPIPRMVDGDGEFTFIAKALNVGGGVLLFVAAARMIATYFKTNNVDDLLFCLHCSLFGAAGIMFEQSTLWDLPWWGWHLLRLMAYGVALWFVVLTEQRAQGDLARTTAQLQQLNATLEQRVAARTEELARSNADLQQFAYAASHDLQEPLRMVASYLQLIERRYKGKLDTDADEFIQFAVDGAHRMKRLINDLLKLSRVGTRREEFGPVDCSVIVGEVVANLRASLDETEGRIDYDGLPTVYADRSQLVQLFQNLIGNAIKYRRDRRPVVSVEADDDGQKRVFRIKDNGIGIDPQHRERIFGVFQRLHSAAEYPGTGIGLAVCKRIVERHGGRIWVESEPENGSTFYFTLPRA